MENDNEISPLVRRWLREANDEELREATANFRSFLAILYDAYLKRERERERSRGRDKSGKPARLERNP